MKKIKITNLHSHSKNISYPVFKIYDAESKEPITTLSGYRSRSVVRGLSNAVILYFHTSSYGVYDGWRLTWSGKNYLLLLFTCHQPQLVTEKAFHHCIQLSIN